MKSKRIMVSAIIALLGFYAFSQPITVRNLDISVFAGDKIVIDLGPIIGDLEDKVVPPLKLGNLIINGELSKVNRTVTYVLPKDLAKGQFTNLKVIDGVTIDRLSVDSYNPSPSALPRLLFFDSDNEIKLIGIDSNYNGKLVVQINGTTIATKRIKGEIYIKPPQSLISGKSPFEIFVNGRLLGVVQSKQPSRRKNYIFASERSFNNKDELREYVDPENKGSNSDWDRVGFNPEGLLYGIYNSKHEGVTVKSTGGVCGKNMYSISNVSDVIGGLFSQKSNNDPLFITPNGSIWPTGDAEYKLTIDSSKLNQMYVDKYTEISKLDKNYINRVVVHILDTGAAGSDPITYTVGGASLRGHGSVIKYVIDHVVDKFDAQHSITSNVQSVCNSNLCSELDTVEEICKIRDEALNSSDKHIINLSMGSSDILPLLTRAINDALAVNVTVVLSYGNQSTCIQQAKAKVEEISSQYCKQYPQDDWSASSRIANNDVSAKNKDNRIIKPGLYIVGSEFDQQPQVNVNRLALISNYVGLPDVYAPVVFYPIDRTSRTGTSFSAGYFTAALALWRSCMNTDSAGPDSNDLRPYLEANLSLNYSKMLKDCK